MKKNNSLGNNVTRKVPIKHFLLIMRIAIFLLMTCVFFSFAETGLTQNTRVTFNKRNVSLKEILNEIESQTDYLFIYSNEVNINEKVSVKAKQEAVSSVLNSILHTKNIKYTMEGNHIILSEFENNKPEKKQESDIVIVTQHQQRKTITGTIVDAAGVPVIGANIVEIGTTNGTVTDINGNFTLSVSNNAIIRISYIGYLEQDISTTGKNSFNITLIEDTQALDEVVVVGYGTMRKSDLTGSVASIKGDELVSVPVRSAAEALQGKAPGVTITSTGGSPGSPPAVRIRGIGTVNGNDPLYVIDGFPQSDIGWLNQNDIQAIEILKDASAEAIYGSRGANGVVIITTKKGTMNSTHRMNINLDAYYGVQNVTKKFDMMNAEEFIDYRNLAYKNGTGQLWISDSDKQQLLGFLRDNFDSTAGTNWQNEIFQTAPIQNYNLSVTNGTERTSYYTSLGYMNQEGIVKESDFERISWRTTVDNQLSRRAKLSSNFSIVYQSRRNVIENTIYDGTIFCSLTADPVTPVFRTNLRNIPPILTNLLLLDKIDASNTYTAYSPVFFNNRANPVAQQAVNKDNIWKDVTFRGGSTLDLELTSWLKYRGTINMSIYRANPSYFTPSYYIGAYQNNTDGYVGAASYFSNYTVIDNLLTFDKTYNWKGKQHTTFLLGNSVEMTNGGSFGAGKTGIVTNAESQKVIDAATKTASASGTKYNSSLVSYFGRLFHSWQDKYMLTATLRYDGSSNFGVGHKWGIFPSFSVAWSFIEEDFIKNLPNSPLSNGKLRFSWGQIGNQAIGGGAYRSTYSLNNGYYYYNQNFQLAGGKSYMGNPNVKWETTLQTDIGLDLGFFNNKLTFTADYFYKTTKDMLLQVPLPHYLGYTNNPWTNAGSIENKGIELDVNYVENVGDFTYSLGANFFNYKNKVISLGGGQPLYGVGYDSKTITKTEVGKPVGYFYGLKTDGIFQSQEEIDNYKNAKGTIVIQDKARPGDLRFVDIDEDGLITDGDRTYIGSPFPKFTYGINGSLAYKGIDFSFDFYGVHGNTIMNMKKLDLYSGTAYYNGPKELMDIAWTETNKSNTQFRITTDNSTNVQVSNWLAEDGSYIQLKNIQLGYKLPSFILRKIHAQEMRLWIGAYNLFTFTKYTGMSPEIGDGSPLFNGVDIAFYPQARQYLMGVNIKF